MQDITFPAFLVLPVIRWTDDVKIVYDVNYYDGPLDGLLNYLDEQYWFTNIYEDWIPKKNSGCDDCDSPQRIRWYALFVPTKEQLDMHNYWHGKFEHCKSTGTLDDFYPPYQLVKWPPFTYAQAKYLMIED